MVLESLQQFFVANLELFGQNSIVTFLIFAGVVFVLYKFLNLLFHAVAFAFAGAVFPFIANGLLGWTIPITIESIIFFATSAVILFLAFAVLKKIFK